MKQKLYLTFAFCAILLGCTKEASNSQMDGKKCNVTIEIAGAPSSKTVYADDTAARTPEGKVSSLEVFIFSEDGTTLTGHDRREGATSLDVTCKSGQKTIVTVINAPDLSQCTTLESVRNHAVALSSMAKDKIVMYGQKSAFIEGSTTVVVDVFKQATRVVIRSIENKFSLASLQSKEFKVTGIYLINVQGANNLGQTAYQGGDGTWYNKMKNEASSVQGLLYDSLNETIAYGSTYTASHYFYAMPNDFTASSTSPDNHSGAWGKRYTRLVVEAALDGVKMYYPITMTSFSPNASYEIEKLVITKTGSSDPDTPVDSDDVSFSVEIKPWDVVLLGSSGVVTI